jgi:hypothetical protein
VVEGEDANYRNLTVGRTLLAAMRERLDQKPVTQVEDRIPPIPPAIDNRHVLGALDLGLKLDRRENAKLRERHQGRLNQLSRNPRFADRSVILVRGNDAAGGRRHPAHHPGARRPAVPDHPGRRAHGRGARAALSVALLAARTAAWTVRDFRPLLVWPRPGGACRGLRAGI